MYGFGSGQLWEIDTTANPTPARIAGLQECSVDFAMGSKELFGEFQFPVAVARTTGKISCKAKYSQLQARLLGTFFNATKAAGQVGVASGEAHAIATAQVTATHAADFNTDMGVRYAATGLPFVRVAATPAVGQYSVNEASGVYAFNATENAVQVKIDYTYDIDNAGDTITLQNAVLGAATSFKAVFTQLYDNKRNTLVLNRAMSSKLTVGSKLEDFTQPEVDFGAFSDESDVIGTWSFAEAS